MKANDFFVRLMEIEPLYEPEGVFFKPFWDFDYRFRSIQHHWELNREYIADHLDLLEKVDVGEFSWAWGETGLDTNSAEFHHMLDFASEPFEFMVEYLRMSTISFSLALVENLLSSLSKELSQELGIEIEFSKRRMPFMDRYIHWLIKGCGLPIEITKELNKEIAAIREVRNRFMHQIDRDFQEQTKIILSGMVEQPVSDKNPVSDDVVTAALITIAELVKILELAYIEFQKQSA
jgi:hypothetical protein